MNFKCPNTRNSKKPLVVTRAEMFTRRRSNGNERETTCDPECTAIVGRTPPDSTVWPPDLALAYLQWKLMEVYNPDRIRFVKWTPTADSSVWQLHYNSLHITQPLTLDNATRQQLDDTYSRLNHRLSQQLDTVCASINTINDASIIPLIP